MIFSMTERTTLSVFLLERNVRHALTRVKISNIKFPLLNSTTLLLLIFTFNSLLLNILNLTKTCSSFIFRGNTLLSTYSNPLLSSFLFQLNYIFSVKTSLIALAIDTKYPYGFKRPISLLLHLSHIPHPPAYFFSSTYPNTCLFLFYRKPSLSH